MMKLPLVSGTTRNTLPAAVNDSFARGTSGLRPTANRTREPRAIATPARSRMPWRLMFSDSATIWPELAGASNKTGKRSPYLSSFRTCCPGKRHATIFTVCSEAVRHKSLSVYWGESPSTLNAARINDDNPASRAQRFWCPGTESNRHAPFGARDFKSRASASFATRARRIRLA